MSFLIYKQFGRVIGQKEWDATIKLVTANWYENPFLKFIIWKEKVKRYLSADIKLKSDNPFGYSFIICCILFVVFLMILGKLIL